MDYKDRMRTEWEELNERATKLHTFMNTRKFNDLLISEQTLLKKQYKIMLEYLDILDIRIDLAELKSDANLI